MVCISQGQHTSMAELSNSIDEAKVNSVDLHDRQTPIVHTSYGDVQGIQHRLPSGVTVDVFLGIPFAKPPVEELRFEKPEPPLRWHPKVLQADHFGPAAIPLNWDAVPELVCSEDCLHLNVFRPTAGNPEKGFPVMVYIHGGGFAYGSTREYGFQGWSERFMPEGIMVVTIQYRLGPFGFLALDDNVLPGNLGLWDMAAALRFVHAEIGAFGGDPARITVVGLSAGAAASACMALSPHTHDLLHGSVEMSGTALAEWSASVRALEVGREFVQRALGVQLQDGQNDDLHQIKQQLKAMTAEQIIRVATKQMATCRADPNLLMWTPRIDGDFLPQDLPELVRQLSRPEPVLMGVTAMEALYLTVQAKDPFLNPFGVPHAQQAQFDMHALRAVVERVVLGGLFRRHLVETRKLHELKAETIMEEAEDAICAFYSGEQQNGQENNQQALEQYTRLISDLMFNVPLIWMARHRVEAGQNIFLYLNEYFNTAQYESSMLLKGATHGNEYPYINGLFPIGEFEFNEADKRHQQFLVKMLANFVKNGQPSVPDSVDGWPRNSGDDLSVPLKFVRIADNVDWQKSDSGSSSSKILEAIEASATFWSWFTTKYGFNLVRGVPASSEVLKNDL